MGEAEEGEMTKRRREGPRTEAETKRIKKIAAAHRTAEARARMSKIQQEKFAHPVRGPAVREHISNGTKEAYKRPEVKENLSNALVDIWDGNTERRKQASATAKQVFRDPKVEQKRQERFNTQETRDAISEAGKFAWKDDEERRQQVSKWAKELWAKRAASVQLPTDWKEKSIEWRIIGTELLLQSNHIGNEEVGRRLDKSRILRCPYADTWEIALSSDPKTKSLAATKLVGYVRKWVDRPGKTPKKKI